MKVHFQNITPQVPFVELLKQGDDSLCLEDLKALAEATYPGGLVREHAVELLSLVFRYHNSPLVGYMIDLIMVAQPRRVISQSRAFRLSKCHVQGIAELLSTGQVTEARLLIRSIAQTDSLVDFFDSLRGCATVQALNILLGVAIADMAAAAAVEHCLLAKSDSLLDLRLDGSGFHPPY
jgi:hypothetical protein